MIPLGDEDRLYGLPVTKHKQKLFCSVFRGQTVDPIQMIEGDVISEKSAERFRQITHLLKGLGKFLEQPGTDLSAPVRREAQSFGPLFHLEGIVPFEVNQHYRKTRLPGRTDFHTWS